jgi:hypothetical protein
MSNLLAPHFLVISGKICSNILVFRFLTIGAVLESSNNIFSSEIEESIKTKSSNYVLKKFSSKIS